MIRCKSQLAFADVLLIRLIVAPEDSLKPPFTKRRNCTIVIKTFLVIIFKKK